MGVTNFDKEQFVTETSGVTLSLGRIKLHTNFEWLPISVANTNSERLEVMLVCGVWFYIVEEKVKVWFHTVQGKLVPFC